MNLKDRYNLWKFRKSNGPSNRFKDQLHAELDKVWSAAYGPTPWYAVVGVRPAVALAGIVILLGGGGAYAYSNPGITEGTVLYPVKQAMEDIEEITKVTPEAKAQFLLKQITRREAEKKVLQKQNIVKKSEKDTKDNAVSAQVPQVSVKQVERKVVTRAEQEKLEKTERAIERTVRKLEESGKALEKNGTVNSKLQIEIKNQVEQRREEIKKNLENRMESRSDRQENTVERPGQEEEKNPEGPRFRELLRIRKDF